jgi:hypothetical protein
MSYLEIPKMRTLKDLAVSISKWIEENGTENFHLLKLKSVLEEYDGTDWKCCPKLSGENYCRHKENLDVKHHGTKFDIFILSWFPGCGTKVHNHPNTGCIYKILKGQLLVDTKVDIY